MWTGFLTRKYFFSKRKEGMISLIGGISVLGVALGVAALIIVLSVMNGFDREIKEKIIGTYAHILVLRDGGIEKPGELIERLEEVPGVESASSFITGQAILRVDEAVVGILLKGVDPEKESEVSRVIEYAGGDIDELKGDSIILGSQLMANENIAAGEEVEIMIPYSAMDLEKTELEVVGSFTSGRYDYDANIAVVDISTAEEMFRTDGRVTGLGLRVSNELTAEAVKLRIQDLLKYPYIVKSWMDLDRNLVAALAMEKRMMFLILALIVMVACFNISGSLIMMVMEKTRDIGILKAIGANSRGVSLVFLMEGALIGVIGVLAGALAGIFIALRVDRVASMLEKLAGVEVFPSDVYYFSSIPVSIDPGDVGMVVSLALGLTLLAGIYPAWKASRLDPVEAIRYE
ncbi:MAG: lipoprotein-releasing ABC transporter permease subunit [Candidatus Omnitrophica bacterium]|nr:lipoprotein-releasing ABC transporter permease subunit [Candidatus Omnitrophota bacterium]